MEDILNNIRGAVIMTNDSFITTKVGLSKARRTVNYEARSYGEIYMDEIRNGDNVIFVATSDDPAEPNRIISAQVATNMQLVSTLPEGTPKPGPQDITIEFTAIQSEVTPAMRDVAQRFIDRNLDNTVGNGTFHRGSLADALKDMGPLHLDPIKRDVLANTPFDYVVPIRGNTVLKARGTVEINHRTHRVIQQGDLVPPHRASYLFIGHDNNDQPTGGFILRDIFLSEFIGQIYHLPGLPANTKWVDRREAEKVKFDFRPVGEPQAWYIITLHAGEIVYNDPKAILDGIGDKGVVLQPNTPLPTERVNVMLLDYDAIPGIASRMYGAFDVDLSKIVKEGRIAVKRPPNCLPGFLINDVIFSETMTYTFQFYGNHTNYPRFRE